MSSNLKPWSWCSERMRRTRLSWTLWCQRRRTRRLAKQLERVKQELATLQVLASERLAKGRALEEQLLPLLAPPPTPQPQAFNPLLLPEPTPEPRQLSPQLQEQIDQRPWPSDPEIDQLLGL